MQALVKMVTKMSLTKHKLQGKTFESFSRTTLSQGFALEYFKVHHGGCLPAGMLTVHLNLLPGHGSGKHLVLLMEVSDS